MHCYFHLQENSESLLLNPYTGCVAPLFMSLSHVIVEATRYNVTFTQSHFHFQGPSDTSMCLYLHGTARTRHKRQLRAH